MNHKIFCLMADFFGNIYDWFADKALQTKEKDCCNDECISEGKCNHDEACLG